MLHDLLGIVKVGRDFRAVLEAVRDSCSTTSRDERLAICLFFPTW